MTMYQTEKGEIDFKLGEGLHTIRAWVDQKTESTEKYPYIELYTCEANVLLLEIVKRYFVFDEKDKGDPNLLLKSFINHGVLA